MSFGGGGFFGSGAQQSEQSGASTIVPNVATEASANTAPILNFQTSISTTGDKSGVFGNAGAPQVTVYSQQTDYGALAAASQAVEQGVNLAGAGINLAGFTTAAIGDVTETALQQQTATAGKANDIVAAIAGHGLDAAQANYQTSLNFASSTQGEAYNFANSSQSKVLDVFKSALGSVFDYTQSLVGDVIQADKSTTATTVSGLTALASQNSTTSDQRIQEITKYALIAVSIVVGLVVLAPAVKGARV